MFATKVKKYRKMQCYTQKDLALKLNVCRTTISAWENNISEPDIKTIVKLKKIFDINYEDLLE